MLGENPDPLVRARPSVDAHSTATSALDSYALADWGRALPSIGNSAVAAHRRAETEVEPENAAARWGVRDTPNPISTIIGRAAPAADYANTSNFAENAIAALTGDSDTASLRSGAPTEAENSGRLRGAESKDGLAGISLRFLIDPEYAVAINVPRHPGQRGRLILQFAQNKLISVRHAVALLKITLGESGHCTRPV